jgi:hypothetical protein
VKETVKVNDPELVTAFRGLDQDSADMLTKVLAAPAKALRAGATLSPDFIVRNIVRDFMTAFVNTGRALFSPIDTAKGLVGVIRKDADFQNWMKGGGANATMVALDRRYMQESLAKLNGETGLMERGWNVVTSPIRGLRMVSELAENATRLGEFKKPFVRSAMEGLEGDDLRLPSKLSERGIAGAIYPNKNGKRTFVVFDDKDLEITHKNGQRIDGGGVPTKEDIQAAGYSSREVTLDFARIGASTRAYNAITAFGNAQIQGADRLVRAFKDNPVSDLSEGCRRDHASLGPALVGQSHDERYKELPAWQRDLFWIMLTKDHIYRIPKPFEAGVIFGSGVERVLDATIGNNPEAFAHFSKSIMSAFSPNFVPTIAAPIVDQFANRSTFTDRTLIPASMEKFLPEYQYTEYTTETSKALGRLIASFPGVREASISDDSLAGPAARAATSPILMENYLRHGPAGSASMRSRLRMLDCARPASFPIPVKPEATLADIPFVKAFAVRYPSASAQSIQDFYDGNQRSKTYFDTWIAKAKEGDADAHRPAFKPQAAPAMFVRLDGVTKVLASIPSWCATSTKIPKCPRPRSASSSISLLQHDHYRAVGQADAAADRCGKCGQRSACTQTRRVSSARDRAAAEPEPRRWIAPAVSRAALIRRKAAGRPLVLCSCSR